MYFLHLQDFYNSKKTELKKKIIKSDAIIYKNYNISKRVFMPSLLFLTFYSFFWPALNVFLQLVLMT